MHRTAGLFAVFAALAWSTAVPAQGVDQAPGQSFEVTADSLPEPGATGSAVNPPDRIRRPRDATLRVPDGFTANLFAEDLRHPRALVVAANGDIFLAESGNGRITLLRDADGDGQAETQETFADGFARPHGMAFRGGHFYVADLHGVWRAPYEPGDNSARGRFERVTPEGAFGSQGGHWTRNIAFTPDGSRFFVAIGSAGNVGEEPEPRATVQVFNGDGSGQRTYATGLRNPVGIAFHPGTSDLYVVVNERDGLGDGLVPDYLTRVREGGFYGWPYSYIGSNPQPGFAQRRPDLVARAIVPDLLFASHSAPIGLVFYDGDQFPEDYRGDAFVALRGSWNSGKPTGYKVVRVPFENGRPVGHYINFATGFWLRGTATARVWGRPAGVAVAGDGSLLIADDTGQTVWRVSYGGN